MNNPIKQFIKHTKEHGFKQTIKDWKRNFLLLQTPELINKQKIQGTWGMTFGLLLILIFLFYLKIYYATIAIAFGIFMQYITLKQLYAEKQVMSDLKNRFEEVQ